MFSTLPNYTSLNSLRHDCLALARRSPFALRRAAETLAYVIRTRMEVLEDLTDCSDIEDDRQAFNTVAFLRERLTRSIRVDDLLNHDNDGELAEILFALDDMGFEIEDLPPRPTREAAEELLLVA